MANLNVKVYISNCVKKNINYSYAACEMYNVTIFIASHVTSDQSGGNSHMQHLPYLL